MPYKNKIVCSFNVNYISFAFFNLHNICCGYIIKLKNMSNSDVLKVLRKQKTTCFSFNFFNKKVKSPRLNRRGDNIHKEEGIL